nr:hypothetical protein [uncultured Acetatifactor sp.]
MKHKKQKRVPLPFGTLLLLGAAVSLLMFSAVGSTRAALTYYSETYSAQIDVQSIGVTLLENDKIISYRDYTHADDEWYEASGKLLEFTGNDKWQIGRDYEMKLKVRNSGAIDEYVRVKLYKYWVDKEGRRLPYLSPALIDLHLLTGEGWILDENATTAHVWEGDGRDGEMIVLYYDRVLEAVDENGSYHETTLFADSITIDSSVAAKVTEYKSSDGSRVYTVYDYDGASFVLEAEVDAVQTHNAENAVRSAWGVNVEIGQDGGLRLK